MIAREVIAFSCPRSAMEPFACCCEARKPDARLIAASISDVTPDSWEMASLVDIDQNAYRPNKVVLISGDKVKVYNEF